jgi:hypothetical protein
LDLRLDLRLNLGLNAVKSRRKTDRHSTNGIEMKGTSHRRCSGTANLNG